MSAHDWTALLSAFGGALVAIVTAAVWVGALRQRMAVAEARIADEARKCEADRAAGVERAARQALYEHRTQQAELVANAVRSEVVALERATTQLAAEHDATRDLLGDVRGTIKDMSRKIDRLLGLQADTPPHGLPQTRD